MNRKRHCKRCGAVTKRDGDMFRCTSKKCGHTQAWNYVSRI